MWSNGGVGGKSDDTCTVGSWGRQARTQVNRHRHSSCTASYVLTCRLGLGFIGNTGCYTASSVWTAGTGTH